jgi:hypothetical protein
MANFFGVCIIGYISTILMLVMNPRWKRVPLDESELQCLNPQ